MDAEPGPFPAGTKYYNQSVLSASAFVPCLEVHFTYFQKGHSHGLPDQRFSEVRSALLSASWIQDLQDFLHVIEGGVKGRQGRELRTSHVEATYDYKDFFSWLEWGLSGHVQTAANNQKNLQACHSFLLVKRKVARNFAVIVEPCVDDEPEHEDDIIMITKLYMSSDEVSQAFRFLPQSALSKLSGYFPVANVPLKNLPEKTMKD